MALWSLGSEFAQIYCQADCTVTSDSDIKWITISLQIPVSSSTPVNASRNWICVTIMSRRIRRTPPIYETRLDFTIILFSVTKALSDNHQFISVKELARNAWAFRLAIFGIAFVSNYYRPIYFETAQHVGSRHSCVLPSSPVRRSLATLFQF